ncbi:MAG: LuxR C-terminal-related transcriptional regulator [Alphaproteobacteria bacterium]
METPIITTSLSPPMSGDALIMRPHLVHRINDASQHKLTVVNAPAGFGKTTLLTSWYQALKRRSEIVGWLSLDEAHNDVTTFLTYLISALRVSLPNFGEVAMTLLRTNLLVAADSVITTLANEMAFLNRNIYIVLDDFHVVTDEDTLAALDQLVHRSTESVHFIIAGRGQLPLPVARLRELRKLLELGPKDLRFSQWEVEALFRDHSSLELERADLVALGDSTEGWAAALQLALIILRDEDDPAAFVKSFSEGHRHVADFLWEDVIGRLPTELRDFLTQTSVLTRLSAPLCDYVLERSDSARRLEDVERRGMFLFPLDEKRAWYRYHHLFAEILKRRLDEERPDAARRLSLRASQWCRDNNQVSEAIHYAIQAEAFDLAGEILNAEGETLIATGQVNTAMQYARRLPDQVLDKFPSLQLDRVWALQLQWQFERADKILGRVAAHLAPDIESGGIQPGLYEKLLHRQFMSAVLHEDMPKAEELTRKWLEMCQTPDPYFEAAARSCLIYARREQFDCGLIESEARVRQGYIQAGADYGAIWHDCIAGPTYVMLGQLDRADESYRKALDVAIKLNGKESAMAAMASLLQASIDYERNDIESARMRVDHYLPFAGGIGLIDKLISGYVTASRVQFHLGKESEADEILFTGEKIADERDLPRLKINLVAERLRQMSGRAEASFIHQAAKPVLDYLARRGHDPAEKCVSTDLTATLAWARVVRNTPENAAAIASLQKWLRFLERREVALPVVQAALALAGALFVAGDRTGAQRAFNQALTRGAHAGFVRTFLDEGPIVARLLEDHAAGGTLATESGNTALLIRTLMTELGDSVPDPSAIENETAATVEALSEREMEILRLVDAGLANQEIANRLGLGYGTVKWYLQQIYGKLGVHRRSAAVHKARSLGFIRH